MVNLINLTRIIIIKFFYLDEFFLTNHNPNLLVISFLHPFETFELLLFVVPDMIYNSLLKKNNI